MTAKLRSGEMAEGSGEICCQEKRDAPPDLLTVPLPLIASIGRFEDYQVFVETTGEYAG
jgi:hypothetical protein